MTEIPHFLIVGGSSPDTLFPFPSREGQTSEDVPSVLRGTICSQLQTSLT